MRKLLMIAAMAVAFVAPAEATEFTKSVARVTSSMVGYQEFCDKLPPGAAKALDVLLATMSDGMAVTEDMNTSAMIDTVGVEKWCSSMRPIIDKMK